jgi:small subunit ribosomal protein S16
MRMGKKKQPTYRVVAADSRSPRDGRFIEIVGVYDPRRDPSAIRIDNDKAVDWLRKGAQPTDSVRKLLEISGAWETFSAGASIRPAAEGAPAAASTAGANKAAAKATAEKAAAAAGQAAEPAATETPDAAAGQAAEPAATETPDAEAEAEPEADAAGDDAAEVGE